MEAVQRARLTGVKIAVTREVLETRLAGLPAGVTVGPRRIEVRFDSAEEALVQLVALAQALTERISGSFSGLSLAGAVGVRAREEEEIWWTETERRG